MKFQLTFLLLFCLISTCFGQSKITDYTLNIDFVPSFISPSKLVIKTHVGSGFISLVAYGPKAFGTNSFNLKDSAIVKGNVISSLTGFMKTYKFQIKGSIDTVGTFKGGFFKGDTTTHYNTTIGIDGIDVYGNISKKDSSVRKFAFWSPKTGTANDELVKILFRLMYGSFKNEEAVKYLEQLEQYFPHPLGLKKLTDKPLKYKLYGYVSSTDSILLTAFFDSLPHNRDVFIDMSNFNSIGTMFYPIIKNYCDHNKRIYWINANDRVMGVLYKIGIASKNVVSKKRVIRIDIEDGWKEKVIFEDN